MICNQCKEQGKKSIVYSSGNQSTLMGFSSYYDEEGVYHSHDPNTITSSYFCSNGHRFLIKSNPKCPNCDYGEVSNQIFI